MPLEVSQTIAAVEISVIEAGEESPGFIGQGARYRLGGANRRQVQQREDRLHYVFEQSESKVRVKGGGKSAPHGW